MCYQKVLQALSEFCYCRHNVCKDDTVPPPTLRKPSNHIPVHNKDCVIMSQSFVLCDCTTLSLLSPLMLLLVWGEWPPA